MTMPTEEDFFEDDWQIKLAWMRAGGVVTASWAPDGKLAAASLGPPPQKPNSERDNQRRGPTADERRAEVRRVTLMSGPQLREVPRDRSDT